MRGESNGARTGASKQFRDQLVSETCAFGKCVVALAGPIKPGAWLAARTRYSKRHADRLIAGKRKVSARALAVLIGEVLD
jgi:hypothetical protein